MGLEGKIPEALLRHRRPFVEGVCQLIGFLGGVFTFFRLRVPSPQ